MDVALLIRQRLKDLGLEQRDLASAAEVTESYISQLLSRKKAPPAPTRTDLYGKIEDFLALPKGELAKLAHLQRKEELKNKVVDLPNPLFVECRELILRKCDAGRSREIEAIFRKQPFGELERLITQKLLDLTQGIAREELRSEEWLRLMAHLSGRSYEEMRVALLEFLDTDVFDISVENWVSFLEPMIDSWDIDLRTFALEIVLNRRLSPERIKRFEFTEKLPQRRQVLEPGLERFLMDTALSGDITEEETEFLKRLKFDGRHPVALYFYRELQNLRDPLHFQTDNY